VRRFLQTLREQRRPLTDLAPALPSERFSARKAVWLFIREQTALSTQEQEELTFIRQASPTAEIAYGLMQEFLTMVRKRRGNHLDAWIEAVSQSAIPELQSFVTGLLKDKDAVVAGLTLPYSNGPVEAQVQKRETWSSALCLAVPSFLSYGNVCSMLPGLCRCFRLSLPSPANAACFSLRVPSRSPKHVRILPSFLSSVASRLTFFSDGSFLLSINMNLGYTIIAVI
jgi:hypothetical protein